MDRGKEVEEQRLLSVTVSVITWVLLTTIDCVVSPVDQTLPVAELEVSVTL
jgi:hypothetical protein